MEVKKIKYNINNGYLTNEYGTFDLLESFLSDHWEKDQYVEDGFIDEVYSFNKFYLYPMNEADATAKAVKQLEWDMQREDLTEAQYWERKADYISMYMSGVLKGEVAFQNILN